MTPLYKKYLDVEGDFLSYDDFQKNYRLKKIERFNFAYDVVDEIAKAEPSREALCWTDANKSEKRISFGEMKELSDKCANMLLSLGLKKGDYVLVILKRHWEFWPLLMGMHKLGVIAIPATHLLMSHDIVYRCNAANVKAIFCSAMSQVSSEIDKVRGEIKSVDNYVLFRSEEKREGWLDFNSLLSSASASFEKPVGADYPCDSDTMLLYFTSGTTGMPKMVQHNYLYPLGHIITAVYWQQVIDGGLHFTISETGWMKSVWGKLYGQWLAGSSVFVYDFDKFVPSEILSHMQDYHVTTFCCPPTMYRFILQEDFSKYDLSYLKHCTVAGEPLPPEVASDWKKRTGIELHEAFGQTELTVTLGTFPWMKVCPGSMGKPSPGFDVDLVDENGQSLPAGVNGEIAVRTHHGTPIGMFTGYYKDDAYTSKVWHDGLYRTGDIAYRDEWGYYWYVSRADDVIKSSGYRIGPFEVESALLEHPAVLETAITGVPDALRGQVVKATIVLKAGYEPSDALKKELQDYVKHATAPYKYPRIIEFTDALPKTISGKIRRVELRQKDETAVKEAE
ncbi:MAG: AMP-binding protein [Eubacteriales bacterium]|nr:AMP-binding protein [Eubacteriales bacterium]MDD3881513.1 AMP-binding protein [Eubacteriales bacterium]MDD4513005.1 AMP-binding protein [Eubacteriales bacterium]